MPKLLMLLPARPLHLLKGGGAQFDNVPVSSIYSVDTAEDGETLVVLLELTDGRIVCLSICPGQPVHASVLMEAGG